MDYIRHHAIDVKALADEEFAAGVKLGEKQAIEAVIKLVIKKGAALWLAGEDAKADDLRDFLRELRTLQNK
jgi:hypothetical protein